MTGEIKVDQHDSIVTITISRPDKLNSVTKEMLNDFDEKIKEAKSEIIKKNMESALNLIRDARLLLTSQEIEQERTVDTEPGPVAEAVKTLILGAKDQFQGGKALEGVTSILDALLLFSPH